MVTIVILVSRADYLERVVSCIELTRCLPSSTSLLAIVDGDDALFVKARNLINFTKYQSRLVTRLNYPGESRRYDIPTRRKRIAAGHNQAGELLADTDGYVLSIEDDTLFKPDALSRLMDIATTNRAFGLAQGVELGRWGVPYVGAWRADDIYDPKVLKSIPYRDPTDLETYEEEIDAGGLYCTLIRADVYKNHNFTSENGLGPDVNLGIELRQLGYQNFIDWSVPCVHLNTAMGKEEAIVPNSEAKIVTLTKQNDTKWLVTY